MMHLKAILLGGCILATWSCASPDPAPDYGPFLEGYAVKEEVEPASYPDTFEPDTLLPGEERIEVFESPEQPKDTDPPQNLDEEPVPDEPFPYNGRDDRWRRRPLRPHPK